MSSFLCLKNKGLVPNNLTPTLTPKDYQVLGIVAIAAVSGLGVWLLGKSGLLALAAFPILTLRAPDGLLNTSELERRINRITEDADAGYHSDARRLLHELEAELGHPAEMLMGTFGHDRDHESWILVSDYLDCAAGVRVCDDLESMRPERHRQVIIDIH